MWTDDRLYPATRGRSNRTVLRAAHRAALAYRAALEATPGDRTLWHNLGLAELERGDLPAAREALERALALGPASARLHLSLADAYWRSGKETEATRHLLTSHRLDPDQPGLRERLTEILGQPPD